MEQQRERRISRTGQAGFSLLEMLVALAILSAAAYVALDTVESDTGQTRYQITENRLEKIRRAIVGNPDLVLNGAPVVSGYVADVGRLPECLDALLNRDPDCNGNGTPDGDASETTPVAPPPAFAQIGTTGVWAGWRGPYLTANTVGLTDGWGNGRDWNEDDDRDGTNNQQGKNWGWETNLPNSAVGIKSLGRDRSAGGTAGTYDADHYMLGKVFDATDPSKREYAIVPDDYQVDLNQSAFHVEVSANRVDTAPVPPALPTDPELTKDYCVALLDIDPADATKWRLIPSDADRDGATDDLTEVKILENAPATTGPEMLVFTADITTIQGNRPLVLYEATGAGCLETGDEADLNDLSTPGAPKNPIVARFGLVLAPRMPHAATFRTTLDFVEP